MESLPAILRCLLEQQPPGFIDVVAVPLWQMVTSLQYLLHSKTPSTASLLSSILSVGREYQGCLSSEAAASRYPAKSIETLLMRIAISQAFALHHAYELYGAEDTPLRSPHLQELIYNPAFVQANLLTVAGWCKLKQEERQHVQQGRAAKDTSTGSSSSSKQGSRSSRQHGNSNRRSSAASPGSGSSSSSSSTPGAVQATAAAAPGSFAQLEVPPDHDLAAAALGKAALAVQVLYAKDQLASAARRGVTAPSCSALQWAFNGLTAGARTAAHTKHLFFTSAVDLQLLVELLALAGAEVEEGCEGMMFLLNILGLLERGLHTVSQADWGAFFAARANMMLQVFDLMLALIRQPKPTQMQSKAATEGACLRQMTQILTSVDHLGCQGGVNNSIWQLGGYLHVHARYLLQQRTGKSVVSGRNLLDPLRRAAP